MLLNVLDKDGVAQKVIVKGQESIVDHSGAIVATGVAQQAIAPNAFRSGFFIQNLGTHDMYFNDLGAATPAAGSILLAPKTFISSESLPVNAAAISITGTAGDSYTAREW